MELNPPTISAIMLIGSLLGLFALLWLKSRLSGEFTTKGEMADLKTNMLADLSKRLAAVEHDLRAAPTHNDIRQLSEKVGEAMAQVGIVAEAVKGMKEGVGRIDRSVERIEKHLLESNK